MKGEEDDAKDKAVAFVEAMLWLLHHSINKYSSRFNGEIANLVKAAVGCANIMYYADLLPDPSSRLTLLDDEYLYRLAIIERWRNFLHSALDSGVLTHLPLTKMQENKGDV